METTQKLCQISWCNKTVRARGWCTGHYERWRVSGNAERPTQYDPIEIKLERLINKHGPQHAFDPSLGRCWTWKGGVNGNGYGCIQVAKDGKVKGKGAIAHRLMYKMYIGAIPEDLVLDHLCHTRDKSCVGGVECQHRKCVNPNHLEPVTQAENNARSNSISAQNAQKTHCQNGHPFNEENTKITVSGSRMCIPCNQEWKRKYKLKRQPT